MQYIRVELDPEKVAKTKLWKMLYQQVYFYGFPIGNVWGKLSMMITKLSNVQLKQFFFVQFHSNVFKDPDQRVHTITCDSITLKQLNPQSKLNALQEIQLKKCD